MRYFIFRQATADKIGIKIAYKIKYITALEISQSIFNSFLKINVQSNY